MQTHVKIVAILYIAMSAFGILAALAVMMIFGGLSGILTSAALPDRDAAAAVPLLGFIGSAIAVLMLALSLPGVAAGFGLLYYKEWARVLAIVLSALNLLNVPFGTALGGYGLWVLLSSETAALFRQNRALPQQPAPIA